MASLRLQVNFNDSSDDENPHLAALDVVPDGDNNSDTEGNRNSSGGRTHGREDAPAAGRSNSRGKGRRTGDDRGETEGGWVGNFVMRAVKRFVGGDTLNHEPFPADQTTARSGYGSLTASLGGGSEGGSWGYGVHQHDPFTSDSTTSSSSSDESLSAAARQQEPENYQINLHESVLQYLRTPEELYLNIILAMLKTGTTQVTADVFRAAAGCPLLIKTFLDSGYTDVNDPEVQRVLQNELDMVLSGDPYRNDILSADQSDYLRCLCNVSSLRINQRQMVLMRYSGFEFIKMLFDGPHLVENIETRQVWLYAFFRVMRIVNMVASWFGVFVSLLFTATVIWGAVKWFENGPYKNNGFWTVICYGVGYVIMLVAVLRTEQIKIKQYENQRWSFPNNNLIIIPAIPVYQIMLVVTALRYELSADKSQYFIIRYDLHNAVSVHLAAHGICHAIPQAVVQLFLFTQRGQPPMRTTDIVCFWLLVGSACASFFMAVFAYARVVIFSHSCDTFGFAVMFVDTDEPGVERKQRIKPSDIATRFLIFFTAAMTVAAAVTLFIFLLNITNCSASLKVFLSVFFGVTGLTVIAMALTLVYVRFSRWFGFCSVPVMVCMIAYFPFTKVHSQANSPLPMNELCAMLVYHFSSWIVPLFVMFGCLCVCFLVWLCMILYECITGTRIQQQLVDNYMNL